jgi:hypothetical protein
LFISHLNIPHTTQEMALAFEKYSDKSFVLRGDDLEDLAKRREITKQLSGSCIWNPRLKNGKGLLIPVSDMNEQVLKKVAGSSGSNTEIKSDSPDQSPVENKERDSSEQRVSPADFHPHRSRSPKSRSEESDKPRSRRKYTSSSSESSSDSPRSYRRRSIRNESVDSLSSQDKPSRKPRAKPTRRASISSEEGSYTSEDERIQAIISRRNRPSSQEELSGDVDSDIEDVISLSRHVRYLKRVVAGLEKKLADKPASKETKRSRDH